MSFDWIALTPTQSSVIDLVAHARDNHMVCTGHPPKAVFLSPQAYFAFSCTSPYGTDKLQILGHPCVLARNLLGMAAVTKA